MNGRHAKQMARVDRSRAVVTAGRRDEQQRMDHPLTQAVAASICARVYPQCDCSKRNGEHKAGGKRFCEAMLLAARDAIRLTAEHDQEDLPIKKPE